MGASLTLTREHKPEAAAVRAIGDGLDAYNAAFLPGDNGTAHEFARLADPPAGIALIRLMKRFS